MKWTKRRKRANEMSANGGKVKCFLIKYLSQRKWIPSRNLMCATMASETAAGKWKKYERVRHCVPTKYSMVQDDWFQWLNHIFIVESTIQICRKIVCTFSMIPNLNEWQMVWISSNFICLIPRSKIKSSVKDTTLFAQLKSFGFCFWLIFLRHQNSIEFSEISWKFEVLIKFIKKFPVWSISIKFVFSRIIFRIVCFCQPFLSNAILPFQIFVFK